MSSLRHTEDEAVETLVQAVNARKIGSEALMELVERGYREGVALQLEHLAAIETVLVKLAAAKQSVPELRTEYQKLVAQSHNSGLTQKYLLGINSFDRVFSSSIILETLKDAHQVDESQTTRVARKIMAFLGTLTPRYLIARLKVVNPWFQEGDLLASIIHGMGLRFRDRDYVMVYTMFIDISQLADDFLQKVEAEYSGRDTPTAAKKSETEIREEVQSRMAHEAFKSVDNRSTENDLYDDFGKGWRLADVWQPALKKYGHGLLKVFPFPELRAVLYNEFTNDFDICPSYYRAVFKALDSAPRVDKLLIELCKAVEDAQSFDDFDSWLQVHHENYKHDGPDMLARLEYPLPSDTGKEWIREQLLASIDIEGMMCNGIDNVNDDGEGEDTDMDAA